MCKVEILNIEKYPVKGNKTIGTCLPQRIYGTRITAKIIKPEKKAIDIIVSVEEEVEESKCIEFLQSMFN